MVCAFASYPHPIASATFLLVPSLIQRHRLGSRDKTIESSDASVASLAIAYASTSACIRACVTLRQFEYALSYLRSIGTYSVIGLSLTDRRVLIDSTRRNAKVGNVIKCRCVSYASNEFPIFSSVPITHVPSFRPFFFFQNHLEIFPSFSRSASATHQLMRFSLSSSLLACLPAEREMG